MILRFADGEVHPVFQAPEGFIAAADASESYAWAVLGTPRRDRGMGSEYTLLRSADRGVTWKVAGPIPFSGVVQLEAVSDVELWIHATSALGRTDDGGITWDEVKAPGARSGRRERLVAASGEVFVLGQRSIRTSDGGESWTALAGDAQLADLDDGWFLGRHDGVIGVRTPQGEWRRLPWSHEEARPLTLAVDGDELRVLVNDRPELTMLRWFSSTDGGRTWSAGRVAAHGFHPSWAIAPDGALFVFNWGRTAARVRRL